MELLDIVNENGIPTGETVRRDDAHKQGILHRTSHVWIARISNGKPQVLLQKRSPKKDSYPGCFDISSAGHIPAGDGFLSSALRELKEELGVAASADELAYCGQRRFEYRETFHGQEFSDNQVSNVYVLYRDMAESDFSVQKSEVDAVLWMDFDACVDMVKNKKAPNCIRMDELNMIAPLIALGCKNE
jgi:isopentenyldiphosphate isomerase